MFNVYNIKVILRNTLGKLSSHDWMPAIDCLKRLCRWKGRNTIQQGTPGGLRVIIHVPTRPFEILCIKKIPLPRSKRKDTNIMTQRTQMMDQVVGTGSNEVWNIWNNIGNAHVQIPGKIAFNIIHVPHAVRRI